MNRWLMGVLGAVLIGGCGDDGGDGDNGQNGPPGAQGADGEPGPDGTSCWDLDENGTCDIATEDTDGNGECGVSDCSGEDGSDGQDGTSGEDATAGTFCGQTPATTANLGGLPAAKAMCVTACGNASAHMCTTHELILEVQNGETFPGATGAWFASGAVDTNCVTWTSSSTQRVGSIWRLDQLTESFCSSPRPVACCD